MLPLVAPAGAFWSAGFAAVLAAESEAGLLEQAAKPNSRDAMTDSKARDGIGSSTL